MPFTNHYQQLKELSENLQICPVALYLHFSILVYVLQTLKLWTVVYKYAPEPIRKAETAVHYYQCASKLVSDHQITVPASFSANRNIEFDMVKKSFLTTFAKLDYNMLCAVMERCKELGWDIE